jgi:DNA repair protein RecN (Recombination protein N)
MLVSLSIQNYAIIQHVELQLTHGLNMITGETGAGKSILLGALGLISGNRADLSVISDSSSKCIVEAVFDISAIQLKDFFKTHDIDDDDKQTIVRREILPGGKSRAFVNDVPVSLSVLKSLSDELIDIHSQHQNLLLRDNAFQLQLLDAFAAASNEIKTLKKEYTQYRFNVNRLAELQAENQRLKSAYDFIHFQFNELAEAKLIPDEELHIDAELKKLTHSEEIKQSIALSLQVFEDSDNSINSQIAHLKSVLTKISSYHPDMEQVLQQLQTIQVESKELIYSLRQIENDIDADPERFHQLEDRNNVLQRLFQKHRVSGCAELINIKNDYESKLVSMNSIDDNINKLNQELQTQEKYITSICSTISKKRLAAIPLITKKVTELIDLLGMPNAVLEIKIEPKSQFNETGMDNVSFLFSANKGVAPADLGKAGSGGEVSRLMLAFKAILSEVNHLPCILFDEIDTGVSGLMADKIGQLMKKMSKHRQLIVITHLPQIASKSDTHFKVMKFEKTGKVNSSIEQLKGDKQVEEIARLLSGEKITEAAINQARELIKESAAH